MQEHRIERYGSAAAAASAACVAPIPHANDMTETATALAGRNGWTLQPKSGARTSDHKDFQC